jgi:hypothetical protein
MLDATGAYRRDMTRQQTEGKALVVTPIRWHDHDDLR